MFLSHKNSIPLNSFQVLDQFSKKQVLANVDGNYTLISNVCPHQKSLISQEAGTGSRVCPYHNWSFALSGIPIKSGRTEHYCKNETPLEAVSAFEWNSLLFNTPINFDIPIDFKNMVLVENRIDTVNANYKIIMDVFLDVDHIQSVHKGVYDLINIKNTDVKWKFYDNGSVQLVEQGAAWISLFPHTMIEWQQGSLFITVALPEGDISNVHVFKYKDITRESEWLLNDQVWETAWAQDKQLSEMITEFADTNLEPQKIHFRRFLKDNGIY